MVENNKPAKWLSPEYRRFTLDVADFSKKRMAGCLKHDYLDKPLLFADWMGWVWGMVWLMEQISFPMQAQVHSRVRKLWERMEKEDMAGHRPEGINQDGHLATFTIHMKSRFFATWQGEAVCEDTGECSAFSSFLELVLWMEPILCRLAGVCSVLESAGPTHGEVKDSLMVLLSRLVGEVGRPDVDGSSRMVDQKLFFGTHQSNGKPMQVMCHVLFMQNRTWQGVLSVRYQDGEYRFRSFLDLAMLYDGEKRTNGR